MQRVTMALLALWALVWGGLFDPGKRWSYRALLAFAVATWFTWRGIEVPPGWVDIAQAFIFGEAVRVGLGSLGAGLEAFRGARTSNTSNVTVIPSEEP